MDKKVKVFYLAGSGRSGSTIIERIFDQIEGFTAVGEICFIWDRSVIEDDYCSCGRKFSECEHWNTILELAYGGEDGIDPTLMHSFYDTKARYHQLPKMMIRGSEERIRNNSTEYIQALEKLYKSIRDYSKAKYIIDSSKFPSYGYLVGLIPDVELYVLHIVRDSRAVAYSWLRKKEYQPGTDMIRFNPLISAALWNLYNWATQQFWGRDTKKYLRMRYEDFLDNPQKNIGMILSWLGIEGAELPFVGENRVSLNVGHSVSGNPSRFNSGVVELYRDDEWSTEMNFSNKLITSLLTFPLLHKYKYFRKYK